MTDPALQALLDKLQIAELLTRYLRSVDRGDIDTLRACYLPGATEDHGGLFAGTAPPITGILTHDLLSGRINVEDPASTEEKEPYGVPNPPRKPFSPRYFARGAVSGVRRTFGASVPV